MVLKAFYIAFLFVDTREHQVTDKKNYGVSARLVHMFIALG